MDAHPGLSRRQLLGGLALTAAMLGLPVGEWQADAAAGSTDIRAMAKAQGLAGNGPSATFHAEFEIRDWLRTRDNTLAANARARLLGVADAWHAAPAGAQATTLGLGNWTSMDQYPHYFTYARLTEAGRLSAADQAWIAPLLVGHAPYTDLQMERGNNNRALQYAGDAIWYAQRNPNAADADKHRRYAESVWRDWTGPGGAWEVMPSYNMILVTGAINLAELLGRTDELRDRMGDEVKRYFEQASGNGVRAGETEAQASLLTATNPDNDYAAWYNAVEPAPWLDPWANFALTRFVNAALKAEYIWRDPEYLWYARTALANGDVPDDRLRTEAVAAIDERLRAFHGTPRRPTLRSHVSHVRRAARDPQIDRLYLLPDRDGPAPFVGCYLFDRNNGYMHTFPNQVGRLYEFSVDGSLLLRTGGKYSREPAYENIVMLTEPWKTFPLPTTDGTAVAPQQWQTATADVRSTRTRWVPDHRYPTKPLPGIASGFPTNPDPTFGFADASNDLGHLWGNLDTYSAAGDRVNPPFYPISFGLMPAAGKLVNMDMNLTGPDLPPSGGPMTVHIRNLTLVGPAGTMTIDPLTALQDVVEVVHYAGDWTKTVLSGTARDQAAHVISPGVLELVLQPGTTVLTFPGLARNYNVTTEFTRVSLDYRYLGDTSAWRRLPISFGVGSDRSNGGLFGHEQAAILRDADTEQRGGDSHGRMSFTNVFTVGTTWQRRIVLTDEGVLVVLDEIVADAAADGWTAGPVWHVGPDWKKPAGWKGPWNPGAPQQGPHWFDAPAFNRANWQTTPQRLLAYFHPQDAGTCGIQQHDQFWTSSFAVFQKHAVAQRDPARFLTVFIPHDPATPGATVASRVTTALTRSGSAEVRYSGVTVRLMPGDDWSVRRDAETS